MGWLESQVAGQEGGGEIRNPRLIHAKSPDFRVTPAFKDHKRQEAPSTKKRQVLFNKRPDWPSHLVLDDLHKLVR